MKPETGADLSSDAALTLTGHSAKSELRAGDVIGGRFRIESLIGIGGMGVVYRAYDQSLEIEVALKLLRPELARRPESFRNFRQELLLARQVSSPHVVRIHDIGEHDGRWFISMDYIHGESLEQRHDRVRKLPMEQALAITRGLLDGLGAAHQRGVVHRDLKPANILLDERGHAYITDFGVARILGATGMTQTGMIVGTPEYLSPEQARGTAIDARSDLYALGLILYEMLAGELPFSGGTPAEAVVQRLLRPPPSLAQARPDLPDWLHAFSDRLLKVNPTHRFDSARQALHALDTQRVPRLPLNRRALSLVALIFVVLIGATTWLWFNPPSWRDGAAPVTQVAPRVGVLPFESMPAADEELASTARALEEHLHNWLRTDAAVAVIPRRRVLDAKARTAPDLQGDALRRQLPDVANAANASGLVRGHLQRDAQGLSLELAWVDLGVPGAPAPIVMRAKTPAALLDAYRTAASGWLGASQLHAGPAPALASSMLLPLGRALLDLDHGRAEATAETLAALPPSDPPSALLGLTLLDAQERARQQLPAQNTRAKALKDFGGNETPAALELYVRALAADDESAAAQALDGAVRSYPHDPDLGLLNAEHLAASGDGTTALAALHRFVKADDQDARAWFLLGRTAIVQGRAQPAVDEYLVRALVLNTRAGDDAAEAQTRNALGIGYERLGQLDAAAEQYSRAAQMREKLGDTAGLGKTLRNLAIVQAQRGDRDTAEQTLNRVKVMLESLGDRASLADLHNDRGVIAEERSDFVAALAAYREALVLRQQLDVPDLVAESLNNVAFSSFQLGQFDNALVYWQQASVLYKTLDDHNGMLRIDQSIGLLDIARGHFTQARERLQASVREAEDRQLSEEASIGHINLAELSLAEGRHAEALGHAKRARAIAARRTDVRTQVEGHLLQARTACALGDAAGIDGALAGIAPEHINSDQHATSLLVQACAADIAGDLATARSRLDTAAVIASESHSGKLAIAIRLQQVRLALSGNQLADAATQLRDIGNDTAHLRELPVRLEWLRLGMASALRSKDPAAAVARYREALALLKGIDRYGGAALLHRIGAQALAASAPEAVAAGAAADAARAQLLADAPPAARASLQESLDRRLREEAGIAHAP